MDKLRKAIWITEECFKVARDSIVLGVTEKELYDRLKKCAKEHHVRLAFPPIVSFGKDAQKIHPEPKNKRLKRNEFAIVDFGIVYEGIRTDVTRTYCIKPDKKKRRLYQLVKNAQKIAERKVKPGEWCALVDNAARKYLKKHTRVVFPYALGHGLGKKTHDKPKISPKSKHRFEVGNLFTLEPGLHSKTFGLRIEDTYLLTKKGIVKLSKNIPGGLNGR